MTADVPDPANLDQLADVLAHHAFSHVNVDGWTVCLCGHVAEGDDDDGSHARHQADVIAAEVEARVQAAAKDAVERAAQAVEALRPHIPPSADPQRRTSVIVRSTLNRAARHVRAALDPSGAVDGAQT